MSRHWKSDHQSEKEVILEGHDFTHKTARYLVPSPDADADDEAVATGADAAELDEVATAWTGRSLATAAEVGVVSEPESLGTHAAEAEDKARARAAICLVENIFETFFLGKSKEWMEWKPVPWMNEFKN